MQSVACFLFVFLLFYFACFLSSLIETHGWTHLISQAQHSAMRVARVRHAGMPGPDVADHDVPPATPGLDGWAGARAVLLGSGGDGRQCLAQASRGVGLHGLRVGGDFLVTFGRVRMRAEPELGRPVLDAEVAEGDVGNEEVREQRVVEAAVLVGRLAHAPRVGEGCVGCQPAPDWSVSEISITGEGPAR